MDNKHLQNHQNPTIPTAQAYTPKLQLDRWHTTFVWWGVLRFCLWYRTRGNDCWSMSMSTGLPCFWGFTWSQITRNYNIHQIDCSWFFSLPEFHIWLWINTYYSNTIFSGMNIQLPAILMFTRGTRVLTHCHISNQNNEIFDDILRKTLHWPPITAGPCATFVVWLGCDHVTHEAPAGLTGGVPLHNSSSFLKCVDFFICHFCKIRKLFLAQFNFTLKSYLNQLIVFMFFNG
jgi:hypothetical protein